MSIYHMINWFFVFSLLGYPLECVVPTYENKTPVINRGFGHGSSCIIYGFGAFGAVTLLTPLADNPMKLYVTFMAMATTTELVTAFMMVRLLGSLWWDYNKKPLNYRGTTCLESSLAWGLLGIILFRLFSGLMHYLAGYVSENLGKRMAVGLVVSYLVNLAYTVREQMRENEDEEAEMMIERLELY